MTQKAPIIESRSSNSQPGESTRERYLAALVTVQQLLLKRQAGPDFIHLLAPLGEAADADRMYYFENRIGDDGTVYTGIRSEWCRPGISPDLSMPEVQDVPAERCFADAFQVLRRGKELTGTRSTVSNELRAMMDITKTKSLLLLPIHVEGSYHGLIGFDNCRAERPWLPDEVDFLRAAAGAIAVAIERQHVEAKLHAALGKLNHYVEKSPLAFIEWDRDFRICSWSHRAEEMFGWAADEVMGKTWSSWQFVYEADIPRVFDVAQGLITGQTPFSISHNRNYTKSGVVRWFDWYNSIIRDRHGAIQSTLSLVLDVTERVRAEEEVRLSLSQAAHTEKMAALGQMAAGVAHDFNNSLTVIIGKTELLLARHALPDKSRQTIQEILTAGLDAASTVRRMQQFVRGRGQESVWEVVDLGQLMDEVSGLTRQRWADQALSRGIKIELVVDHDVPVFVRADSAELREVLTNLIFNAVDAMPKGGSLRLSCGVEKEQAFLRVADSGIGMDAETRRRCLEPFFTTKGIEGTGLGLAVCWSLTKRLGGDLQIESESGKGTIVTLWLPLADATPNVAAPITQPGNGRSRRILVIDDRSDVSQTICGMLRQLEHRPTEFSNGELGLAHLQRERFDLVITDLGLPGLDGREIARRAKLHSPELPVILLTGWADELKANGEFPAGVDLVLSKPVSLDQLRGAIGQLYPTGA